MSVHRTPSSSPRRLSVLVLLAALLSVTALVPPGALPSVAAASTGSTGAPTFTVHPGPAATDGLAGEPSIGVNWATGNVLMAVGPNQYRVTFDAGGNATWKDVTSPFSVTNIDPILYENPATGWAVAGGDDGACDGLSLTQDDGQHWSPLAACPLTADHPTVAIGPPGPDAVVPTSTSPPQVIYACQQQSFDACAVSHDGGLTFTQSPLTCGYLNPGLFGHLRFGPDGTAYVPFSTCSVDGQGVAISTDDGLTWTNGTVGIGSPAAGTAGDPSVAVGRGDNVSGGRIYFASATPTSSQPIVTTSTDHGATWTTPVNLAVASSRSSGDAVGVTGTSFPTVIAGDDDRAAFAFLGTKAAGDPRSASFTGTWDLYVAFTTDGGATWASVDVTPNDPVQRGSICMSGSTGCATGTRNLLDFMDSAVDANGFVLVGFADGCITTCAGPNGTASQSTHALATIARQTGGPCLLAGRCGAGPQDGTPLTATGALLPQVLPAADTCDPNVVVFSSVNVSGAASSPGFNPHAGPCAAEGLTGPGPVDTAVLDPGSNRVQARYLQNLAGLAVSFQGLGADPAPVAMTCQPGNSYCDSGSVAIDPTLQGSLVATVYQNGNPIGAVTYHTAASDLPLELSANLNHALQVLRV